MNLHLNDFLHFASLGRHFTDIHFHLVPGGIIPAAISSTIMEMLRCCGSHAGLLASTDGCNFKILFKACFVSATPLESALDGSELCFRLGQGQDQNLYEEVEHVGLFLKKVCREAHMCYQQSGDRRNVCKSDLGKKGLCSVATWMMTPVIALLLHHSLAQLLSQ